VKAKTVPFFFGGETVGKNAGQVFRRYSNAMSIRAIRTTSLPLVTRMVNCLSFRPDFIARIFRVANQIHQDLQYLVFFHRDVRYMFFVFAEEMDVMPDQGARVHAQGVFRQVVTLIVSVTPETLA